MEKQDDHALAALPWVARIDGLEAEDGLTPPKAKAKSSRLSGPILRPRQNNGQLGLFDGEGDVPLGTKCEKADDLCPGVEETVGDNIEETSAPLLTGAVGEPQSAASATGKMCEYPQSACGAARHS